MNLRTLMHRLSRRANSGPSAKRTHSSDLGWSIDELEPRLLLAGDAGQEVSFAWDSPGIQVQAIGDTGQEIVEVVYNDETISQFRVTDEWATYQIDVDFTSIDPSLLRMVFVNDLYDPAQGIDRNVQFGTVTIGEQVLDSNASSVFSTGTWLPEDGITSGSGRGSVLNTNGYLQYGPPLGSELTVYARGDHGGEVMNVLAGTFRAEQISLSTEMTAYTFFLNAELDPSSIRIEFINDMYRPDLGIDHNLVVDRIEIDGVAYQTEDSSTFAQGVYRDGSLTSGFYQTERLEGRGHFQFGGDVFASERYTLDDSIADAGVSIVTSSRPFDVEHEITSTDQSAVGWTDSYWTEDNEYRLLIQVQLFDENGMADDSFNNGEPIELIEATQQLLNDDSLEPSQISLQDIEVDSEDRLLVRMQVAYNDGFSFNYSSILIRMTTDGQFDSSFGNGGFIEVNLGGITSTSSMTIDSQGRILVGNAATIARFNADGSADLSFGTNGSSGIPLPQEINFYGGQSQLFARADGSIVVFWGQSYNNSTSAGWLIQLNEDGSTGTWFGDDGIARIPYQEFGLYTSFSERFDRVLLDDEGRITVLGTQALIRFSENGQIDASFGDGGRIILPSSIVTDGNLLFDSTVGTLGVDGLGRYLVPYLNGIARLTPDGQLDFSFSSDGIAGYHSQEVGNLQPYSVREGRIDSDGQLRTLAQNDNGFGIAFWQLV